MAPLVGLAGAAAEPPIASAPLTHARNVRRAPDDVWVQR